MVTKNQTVEDKSQKNNNKQVAIIHIKLFVFQIDILKEKCY